MGCAEPLTLRSREQKRKRNSDGPRPWGELLYTRKKRQKFTKPLLSVLRGTSED